MHPQKTFPLLVAISSRSLREIADKAVKQQQSEAFQVQAGSVIEVEPILPGCMVYPPHEQLRVEDEETAARFWVVPQVLGKVMEPRVVVRQDGRVLAEVKLEVRVVKQTLTVCLGMATLVLPWLSSWLKQQRLDFKSQFDEGFARYAEIGQTVLNVLSPGGLMALLLAATVLAYLWLRPRQRAVFWEMVPVGEKKP
jgi:hypothetical protein